jgi:catechol 2,3-dioxygenase-like lactoylglutathione lyase family enzyme
MILNHLNLAVSDVQAARGFLEKYFGLDSGGKKGNDFIAFLRDDNGMVLTLTNIDRASEVKYPGAFHIGFIQESPAKVDEINRLLREDGFEVEPPSRMHGSWTFYFRAPGGFVVEVLSW